MMHGVRALVGAAVLAGLVWGLVWVTGSGGSASPASSSAAVLGPDTDRRIVAPARALDAPGSVGAPSPDIGSRRAVEAVDPDPPRGEAPARVALMGDSVALTLIDSVEQSFDLMDLGGAPPPDFVLGAGMGNGFTTDSPGLYDGGPIEPIYQDWREHWPGWIEETDPDAVVMMMGVWDAIPRLVDGEWLEPGTQKWTLWYRSRVEDFASTLEARGTSLTWVVQPCIDGPHPVTPVNEVVAEVAARHGAMSLVDLSDEICDHGATRRFVTDVSGRDVQVWHEDGIHLAVETAPGVLAPLLASSLPRAWGLQS